MLLVKDNTDGLIDSPAVTGRDASPGAKGHVERELRRDVIDACVASAVSTTSGGPHT